MRTTDMYVGLDVHKDTISIAVAEGGRGSEVRYHGNDSDQPRGPSEDGVSDAGELTEDGRLPALRCGD